jgi:branched-chain amino acid transport system ATP-binding protein
VKPLLDVRGLSVYYGEARAVRGVDLRIEEGEIASVVGPNGAGKSTLVNALAGLLRDRTGEIELDGHDLMRPRGHEVCDFGIAIVPEGRRIFSGMSVQDNLELGAYRKAARSERDARVEHVHGLFPILRERADQRAGTLSGGEQQMLALGRALMSGPKLLLLDEPSLGLAPVIVDRIYEVVREINSQGTTIVLVEQNANYALDVSSRGYVLETGHVVLTDTSENLRNDERVQAAYLGT